MTFTVIVPSAIPPAGAEPDPLSEIELPGLSRLAARASTTLLPGGMPEALCTVAGIACETDWPLAPLAARGEGLLHGPGGGGARNGTWLFATPVQAALSHADAILASFSLAVDAQEADAVRADLDALFATDGLRFFRGARTGQWYVRAERTMRIRTPPPPPPSAGACGRCCRRATTPRRGGGGSRRSRCCCTATPSTRRARRAATRASMRCGSGAAEVKP